MPRTGHDLFLLFLNLSQLNSAEQVRKIFCDAIGNVISGARVTFQLPPEDKSSQQIPEGYIPVATRNRHFGCLIPMDTVQHLPEDKLALLRNAAAMLGVLLERIDQSRQLADTSVRLQKLVDARTRELEEINEQLKDEIDEHRYTFEQLEVGESKYKTYIQYSPTAVFITKKDGILKQVNAAACTLTGLSEDQLVGQMFNVFLKPEDQLKASENFKRIENDVVLRASRTVLRPDGEERRINIEAIRLPDSTILTFCSDITDLVQVREEKEVLSAQLNQAQRLEAIGRLAGGVAHDFNNLLTGISGHVSLAMLDMSSDDPLYNSMNDIDDAVTRASRLTRQLLAFSRTQVMEPQTVDINEILRSLKRMLERLLGEDVLVDWKLSHDPTPVVADIGQIEQVIINMAVNARDAMPDGGRLTIESAIQSFSEDAVEVLPGLVAGDYVQISVSDTGLGMSAETVERVFEPFFTTKSKDHGTGLGLATSYGIIKAHGGFIDISTALGEGTTFDVLLPLKAGTAKASKTGSRITSLPGGSERVLVVEDEPIVRNMAVKILQRLGYDVISAEGGPQAEALLAQCERPVDLLLTDVIMPDVNGKELAERLTAIYPDLIVLYTSGYTRDIIARHGVLDKGINFLPKPYTPQTLAIAVDKILHVTD